MEDSTISIKCTNWDHVERDIKNLEAGVKIVGDAADIFTKLFPAPTPGAPGALPAEPIPPV